MPDRGYRMDGWRMTGALRIRQGAFFAVLEEQWERRDGTVKWCKAILETFTLSKAVERAIGPAPPAKND